MPGLIVIDGGKGQLSAGLKALQPFRDLGVTVVSLAKRIEEVFIPGRSAPLVLPPNSPALQLLQRVRDEAHRFAIEFHRGRRDKAMTRSVLDDLPGRRPGAQAPDPQPLRLARALPGGEPRGARGGARAAGQGGARARESTAHCRTRPGNVDWAMASHRPDKVAGSARLSRLGAGARRRRRAGRSRTSWSSPASRAPASRRRWPASRTPATSASTTCRPR